MSKFLVGERPIILIPSLAVKLGMKEAIVLQHVHYWLSVSRNEKDGRKWVYNTYEEWKKQLPFWSLSTIKRTIAILEEKGYSCRITSMRIIGIRRNGIRLIMKS